MTDATLPSRPLPRQSRNNGFFGSFAFSAGRGAILVAAAIAIGVLLLQVVENGGSNKGSGGSGGAAGATTTTKAPASSSTTTTTKGTTGTTRPVKPSSQVDVLILNGTGIAGVGKSVADKLGAAPLSYKMQPAGNVTKKVTGTTVYYTGDNSGEAAALATAVNAAVTGVTGVAGDTKTSEMPTPTPSDWDSPNVGKAQLVVVVGVK